MIVMIEYLLARDFSIAQPDKGILKNVKACPLQESGEWQMATHVPELAACILDIYIYIYLWWFRMQSIYQSACLEPFANCKNGVFVLMTCF